MDKMFEMVESLLGADKSGHGMEHVKRVLHLAEKFASEIECDKEVVKLIALLHDVDDYKLFGFENSENLPNARRIMNDCGIDEMVQQKVLANIQRIGYSKSLKGIRPNDIEGMIVSDADMCDAAGATGIMRVYSYSSTHGQKFFDENFFPKEKSFEQYTTETSTSVNHMFEKLLKLKNLMLTDPGKEEAEKRHEIMLLFLQHFFDEVDARNWQQYLKKWMENN